MQIDKAANPVAGFIFAHGAGAGSDSDFMLDMSKALCDLGISVLRFDFDYMVKAKQLGKRRPPDRADKLIARYREVIQQYKQTELADLPVFIGGKSMGGRIASMLLEQTEVKGGICMGYPFHPVGKPDKLRIEHLQSMSKPLLVLQGERDTFGNVDEVAGYPLATSVQVTYLQDGDHSFKPRKASGLTLSDNIAAAAQHAATFVKEQL